MSTLWMWFLPLLFGVSVSVLAWKSQGWTPKVIAAVAFLVFGFVSYYTHWDSLSRPKPVEFELIESYDSVVVRDMWMDKTKKDRIYLLIKPGGEIPRWYSIPYSDRAKFMLENRMEESQEQNQDFTIQDWEEFLDATREFQIRRGTEMIREMMEGLDQFDIIRERSESEKDRKESDYRMEMRDQMKMRKYPIKPDQ